MSALFALSKEEEDDSGKKRPSHSLSPFPLRLRKFTFHFLNKLPLSTEERNNNNNSELPAINPSNNIVT